MLVWRLLVYSASTPLDDNCVAYASSLCDADAHCSAFGLYDGRLQLHGCNATVANSDWAIYSWQQPTAAGGGSYARLPGHVNVDEAKCAAHPASMEHACPGTPTPAPTPPTPPPPPPPPPAAKPYAVDGTIDVGTLENSLFSWRGTMYLLENIADAYYGSAGRWPEFAAFKGHSYARVRRLADGFVVANISSTIGFGFISAFPDYAHGRVWLFGTNHDRSKGGGPPGGYPCAGQAVTSWWTPDGSDLTTWARACTDATSADNVEVASVAVPPRTLPPHGYVMSDECPGFHVNDASDGNLTRGWVVPGGTTAGPCGGPSVRWAPEPGSSSSSNNSNNSNSSLGRPGYYYRITGGRTVALARSRDLGVSSPWQSVNMISPTPEDANVSRFAGFAQRAAGLGFGLNHDHWDAWDFNSNDADVCCMDPAVNGSFLVWGASTQGGAPKPPVPHNQSCVNVVGTSPLKLPELLDAFFDTPLPPVAK
jgi:hypothetical protein